jgi:hypothetical protein
VRRLYALAGGFALFSFLRKRRSRDVAQPDPRAEELRRKLAESRSIADERDRFEEAETTVDAAEPTPDVDERRRRVHAQGREATQQMRAPDTE